MSDNSNLFSEKTSVKSQDSKKYSYKSCGKYKPVSKYVPKGSKGYYSRTRNISDNHNNSEHQHAPRSGYSNNYYKKTNMICRNCGEKGHNLKSCHLPITSWGIILVKIYGMEDLNIDHEENLKITENTQVSVERKDGKNGTIKEINSSIVPTLINQIKFLIVSRKHSLGYREFINGKYDLSQIDYIVYLIKQMLPEEIQRIKDHQDNFDYLWKDLWGNGSSNKRYISEYERAKKQYKNLKQGESAMTLDDLLKKIKTAPSYINPEYGFPKGRKNNNEGDMECAIREFTEETGMSESDIRIIKNIQPIVENMTGTDGVDYKHVYYLAEAINDNEPKLSGKEGQKNEIGDVGFYSYHDALQKIRVYHHEKKDIMRNVLEYYLNKLINVDKSDTGTGAGAEPESEPVSNTKSETTKTTKEENVAK